MNKKNIAFTLMLGFFISSFEPCYSMSYMRNSYYAVSTRVHNFVHKCREVGVLATFYALMGIYSFKRITGLDEKKLENNEYNAEELRAALDHIEIMARPSKYTDADEIPYDQLSRKLEDFYTKINHKLEEVVYRNAPYNHRGHAVALDKNRTSAAAHNAKHHAREFGDYVEDKADQAAENTKQFVDKAKNRTKDVARKAERGAENVADRVENNVDYAKDRADDYKQQAKARAHDVADRVEDNAEYAKAKTKNFVENAKDRTQDYAQDAKARAKNAAHQVEDKMSRAKENTKEFVENAKTNAKDLAERAKNRVQDFAENAKETASELSSAAKAKAQELKERTHDAAVNSRENSRGDIANAAAKKDDAALRAKGHGLVAAAETYDAGSEIGHHAKETVKDLATALKEKTKEAAAKVKRVATDAVEYMTEDSDQD